MFSGTETLSVKAMARGGGSRKKGLNREIQAASPAAFLTMVRTKAEEAGSWYGEAPTRELKPTQCCHACQPLPDEKKRPRTGTISARIAESLVAATGMPPGCYGVGWKRGCPGGNRSRCGAVAVSPPRPAVRPAMNTTLTPWPYRLGGSRSYRTQVVTLAQPAPTQAQEGGGSALRQCRRGLRDRR